MIKQTLPTRALLACGAVGGPLYVIVTLAQALTRDGFDMRQHRFTLLTAGDLGWIHQSNMVLVGVLTMLFAVGVSQMLRKGRGAVWAPRLLGLFGLAYVVGGVLTADPVAGFPPGTTPEGAAAGPGSTVPPSLWRSWRWPPSALPPAATLPRRPFSRRPGSG